MRVAVKDTIDIAGHPTRAGSAVFDPAPPAAAHAEVVERLLAGGCRIVGKTHLHELAFGVTGVNPRFGTPPNPRYPDHVPGGSSSGSAAAVAAGLADFALGTDTGGSVRIPAACCGVFGIKPTFGRVSRRGVLPARSTLDCVGVLAGSAAMLARGMSIIDPTFQPDHSDAGVRLGRVEVDADAAILDALDEVLAQSGFAVAPAALARLNDAFDAGLIVINRENWQAFGHVAAHPLLGEDVRSRLAGASSVTDAALACAEAVRVAFASEVDAALAQVDALVLPTMASIPPRLADAGDARTAVGITQLVRPFNLSGHPAVTVPLSVPAQVPVALQLVGRHGDDARLCRIAERLAERIPNVIQSRGDP
nr:amidase [Stenotrophomonas sp. MMGLT7]